MYSSKEPKKKYTLSSEDQHQQLRKWYSDIQSWREGVDVMDQMIKKHAASLSDDNNILELRELYEDIIGDFKNRLQYLSTKIDAFELQYQHGNNKLRDKFFLGNLSEGKYLEREMDELGQMYAAYRSRLSKLLRPSSTQSI